MTSQGPQSHTALASRSLCCWFSCCKCLPQVGAEGARSGLPFNFQHLSSTKELGNVAHNFVLFQQDFHSKMLFCNDHKATHQDFTAPQPQLLSFQLGLQLQSLSVQNEGPVLSWFGHWNLSHPKGITKEATKRDVSESWMKNSENRAMCEAVAFLNIAFHPNVEQLPLVRAKCLATLVLNHFFRGKPLSRCCFER